MKIGFHVITSFVIIFPTDVKSFLAPVNSLSTSYTSLPLKSTSLSATSTSDPQYSTQIECLVVGGGISGSTLAHNLYRNGVDILLTEARDYLGGNVKSHKTEDGFIWEEGPNSFATQPSIVRIAHELGIDDQLVFADESLPPWVNHNGKLHPLPKGQGGKGAQGQIELLFGPNGVLKFALLGELLSWPGRIRAGIGAFLGHAPPPPSEIGGKEETIREWVTRILGEEVFLRCIDPFVSGVYAGNPETLSMKAALPKIARIEEISYSLDWNKFGAIFYGGLKRQVELTKERKANPPDESWVEFEYGNPGSFREGLSTLPKAIAAELDDKILLKWKMTKIVKRTSGDGFEATFETPTGIQTIQAKTIVSTIPAHSMSDILTPVMPEAKSIFDKIRSDINRIGIYHPPVAAVTVAYPKSSFRDVELANGFGNLQNLPGFGSLNPRSEGVRTLGTLWSSSLFPGRCPPDYNLLLNYIGGSRDVSIASLSDDEIIAEVDKGCRQVLLKNDAPPPKVLGLKLWPTAIPQYELGHLALMEELEKAESKIPGLWICGNYRTGVAFPDCVTYGYEHAKIVTDYILQQKSLGMSSRPSESVAELSR
jgi:protoporphyrinogen/coproporphyrinogen III oxidase